MFTQIISHSGSKPCVPFRAALTACVFIALYVLCEPTFGAHAKYTLWGDDTVGWPPVKARDTVVLGGPAGVILDLDTLGQWVYADNDGRVRAYASAFGVQPVERSTKLIWRKMFRKGSQADTAHFTVNRSYLDVKLTEPVDEDTPYARLHMEVALYDPEKFEITTTIDDLSGGDLDDTDGKLIQLHQRVEPQFSHEARVEVSDLDEEPELAVERTVLFGSEVWNVASAGEPGNVPVVKSEFVAETGHGRYEMDPYRGEIRLDGIEEGALYMIEYVLWVSALNNGGEFPVDAFLGDPLDVDSGFQVETTSEPVDDAAFATTCDVQTDPARFRYDPVQATATDLYTGLMWQRCPVGYVSDINGTENDLTDDRCEVASESAVTWKDALQRSADDDLAGHADWRLPNIKELDSIVQAGCHLPAIDDAPFPDTPDDAFWSATPDPYAGDAARAIDSGLGYSLPLAKESLAHARLVRTSEQPPLAPLPALRAGRAAAVEEGDEAPTSLRFPVELDRPGATDVTVDYETRDHTATAGSDYVETSGRLTIPAGVLRVEVVVPVSSDAIAEDHEALYLVISDASPNARVLVDANLGQIDDDEPLVSIGPGSANEGDSGTTELAFTVALSRRAVSDVAVEFASADGTATAGADYTAAAGTLVIPAGADSGVVRIGVLGDTTSEGDENLSLTLSNPSDNARLSPLLAQASGTIVDDDVTTLRALNDTGIVLCSSDTDQNVSCAQTAAFPGQDAESGRDVTDNADADGVAGFSFTKLDTAGVALPDQSLPYDVQPWDCVRDEVTGLEWEVKTDDGGLRDKDWTYTWFNSTGINDGGSSGTANGGVCVDASNCDTEKYVAAVNAQGLCGRSDWRLATREELQSIVNASDTTSPPWDERFFPNPHTFVFSFNYWTSMPDAFDPDIAWSVDNLLGRGAAIFAKSKAFPVRLVRGGT